MATYSTRIYVKVDNSKLMDKLGAIAVDDLGKGFYTAKDIFPSSAKESYFCDTESALNESDIQELVARVADVIKEHGVILADTFSYDYDPMPEVCFFDGNEISTKLLDLDGGEFQETVDICDTSAWIGFVKDAEEISGGW